METGEGEEIHEHVKTSKKYNKNVFWRFMVNVSYL